MTPTGWKCPVCEAVNAPFVLECSCSKEKRATKPPEGPTLDGKPITRDEVRRLVAAHRGAPRMK